MNLSEQTGQQKNCNEKTPLDAIDYARTQAHAAERLDPARPPAVPADLIPGYEILEEIHRGGQGVVYKARRHSTDQLVAIKVLRWGQLARSTDQFRFDRELRVLAKLQHPNIVAVHDGGVRDDVRYFVMDYVRGRTLQQYAQENPPLEARLRVFLRICRAVDAAHRRGVIHRDLKPSNVIVDDGGEPRVVDFGLAKLTEANDLGLTLHQTVEGANFLGSLPWLAPEQAEGHSTTADARTDVYGLGTLLYVLLTQRPPFEIDGPPRRVLNAICHEQPQPPSALVAALDSDLDIITLQCLSKEPHRRYPTVIDLQHDVEQFLAGEPIGARRDSTLYVLRMALRRYRRLTILSVTCVLVITGFAIAMSVLARRIRDERDASRRVNRELMVETARSEIRFGDAVRAADLLWSVHLNQPPGDGVGGSLESRWAMWELYDRQPCLATWQAHVGRVGGLYFSPDGTRLASVGRLDARLKYWDPRNGKLLKDTALSGCSGQSLVSFSPDGARFAMGCDDGSIRLWNIEGGRQEALLEGHVSPVRAVAFTRNGDRLISGGADGSLRIWDVVTQQCIGVLEGHVTPIASLALDATGDLLASFDLSGLLKLWDLSQRELRSTLEPPQRAVDASTGYSVDVHGTTVAFGIDYGVYTWDAATAEKRKLYDHSDAVMGVSFSPTGKWLVSISRDRSIIVWDRDRDAVSQTFRGNDALTRRVAFSPGEEMIAVGLENGAIKLWQMQPHPALTKVDHGGTVHCARYSPDGSFLVSSGYEGQPRIRVWDAASHQLLREFEGHESVVAALAVHPDGQRIASASYDRSLREWSIPKATCIRLAEQAHANRINCLAYDPDGTRLATGGDDGVVRLWNADSLSLIHEFPGGQRRIPSLCFSPDGKSLASCDSGGAIRVHDLESLHTRYFGQASGRCARTVCFSPDGQQLASGGDDRSISLWEVATGSLLASWEAHSFDIFALAFHPSGRLLASAGRGKEIRLWHTTSPDGLLLATLEGHDDMVLSLAFDPNGHTLASGSRDHSVGLWDLEYYDRHIFGNLEAQIDRIGLTKCDRATVENLRAMAGNFAAGR